MIKVSVIASDMPGESRTHLNPGEKRRTGQRRARVREPYAELRYVQSILYRELVSSSTWPTELEGVIASARPRRGLPPVHGREVLGQIRCGHRGLISLDA